MALLQKAGDTIGIQASRLERERDDRDEVQDRVNHFVDHVAMHVARHACCQASQGSSAYRSPRASYTLVHNNQNNTRREHLFVPTIVYKNRNK